MKKILSLLAIMLLAIAGMYGQSPSPGIFNYQGVARNSVGNALVNKTITLRLTIRDGAAAGPLLYQESRTVTTNPFGLFNVQVGSAGTITQVGTIAGVNWGVNTKFIQVEIDPNGGNSFINIGAAQIASVPYSLYSSLANDLVLPFNKTQADNGALFRIVNSGNNTGSTALEGLTNSVQANAAAIIGTVTSGSPGGFSSGVRGINNGTGGLGIGVWGSQNGSGYGVFGTTPTGWAVRGEAATSGVGVYGSSNSGTGGRFLSTSGLALHTSGGGVRLQNINEAANRILATIPGDGTATWQDPSAVGIVTGSGTLNFVPKWTPNGTNLGNSQIFDNGTDVGVGTITPFSKLTVVQGGNSGVNIGGGAVTGTEVKFLNFGTAHMSIYNRGNNALTFANTSALSQTNSLGTELMTLTSAGNLGIGTNAPTARFSVNEQFKVQTNGTVQFANAVNPMMIMFETGTANADRMVVSHSPGFPTWGLQYQDAPDKFNFLSGGTAVLTADLGTQRVGVGAITPNAKLHSVGTGPVYTPLGSVQAHQTGILSENNTASGSLNAGLVSYANGSTLGNRGIFGVAGGSSTNFNIGVGGIANAASTGSNYGIVGSAANGANNWAGAFFGRVQIQDGTQGVNRLFFDNGGGNGTGEWRTLAGAGIVGGSGTLNFVTKWTPDGNNIGNSQIFDNGNTVSVSGGGFVANNSLSILTTPASATNTTVSLITAGQAAGVYLENGTGDLHVTANFNDVGIGDKIMTFEDVSLNVGIGNVNPAYRLDVTHGGGNGAHILSTSGFSAVDIDANNGDAALRFQSNGAFQWNIRNRPADNYLEIFEMGSASRVVVQDGTGNVGISTNNPTARVHVTGLGTATYSSPTAGVTGISPAVIGQQTAAGGFDKTGLVGYAEGGTLENFGVWGVAGTTGTNGNVGGGFVSRSNTANPRYGMYADAGTVAPNSWAGWFNGRVRISDGTQGVNRLFFDDGAGIGTGEWRTPAGAGLVSGSGTLNFVPKWTPDGVTLGNSQITDDGNVVTVGSVLGGGSSLNIRPTTGGSVEPSLYIGAGQHGGIYTEQGTGMLHFTANFFDAAAGNKIMTLDDDGFRGVGIGTTAPAAKLHAVNTLTTAAPDAVLGESANTDGGAVAIRGVISSAAPGGFSSAVRGINNGTGGLGIGVYGSQAGSGWGVYGTTPSGLGVYGNSNSGFGVYGTSVSGTGVYGLSSTGFAGNFENNNVANTLSALRGFNGAANIGSRGISAFSVAPAGTGYPGEATHAALVAAATTGVGIVTSSTSNYGLRAGAIANHAIYGENYGTNAGVFGAGLFAGGFGVVGNAAAGTGAGGYFTGGTTALRTLGGVQLTGINEGVNRILATVPGTGQATWEDPSTVGIVSGSGTLNFHAKWTPNGTTLGNSLIFDNGNVIHAGNTAFVGAIDYSMTIEKAPGSPEASLLFASTAGQANGIYNDNNGEMHFTANSGSVAGSNIIMTLEDATLNVGIGTTAPAAKLHALSTAPDAVLGENSNTAANAVAVRGVITSTTPGGFSSAVRGMNNGTGGLGIGVWGSQNGSGWGVYGSTPSGIGVNGNSNTGTGVNGSSTSGIGVNGVSSTNNAGNFTSTSGANAVPTVRSFNPSANIGAWSMYALSQGTNAYPGNNNSAAIVAESQGNSVGVVASAIQNNAILAASLLNNSVVGQGWGAGMAGIFGTGLFGGTYGVVGNAAAGAGAGGFFTGGTTALRTIGGVQLTGIGEAANRILATVPGTGQATWEDAATVGLVSGSGTLNFIPKWTPNGTTLGNSQMFDDGNDVYVGAGVGAGSSMNIRTTASTITPSLSFHTGTQGFNMHENAAGQLSFEANNSGVGFGQVVMTIDDDGVQGVGIGTLSPTAKLHSLSASTTGLVQAVLGESNSLDPGAQAILGVITSAGAAINSTAVRGHNNSTSGFGIGVWGSQYAAGWGVLGETSNGLGVRGAAFNTGTGVQGFSANGLAVHGQSNTSTSGWFANLNAANASPTLVGNNVGTGAAVYGVNSGTGGAGSFQVFNAANNQPALLGTTDGTGNAGYFESQNAANTNNTVHILNPNAVNTPASPVTGGGAGLFVRKGAPASNFIANPAAIYTTSIGGGSNIGVVAAVDNGMGVAAGVLQAGGRGIVGQTFVAGATAMLGIAGAGSVALRTQGAITLTGIGEAANRILATVPGTGQATWEDASTLGIVSGSGTLNFVPKWTPNGTTLGNSLIFDDGAFVGVGTALPVTPLHVNRSTAGGPGMGAQLLLDNSGTPFVGNTTSLDFSPIGIAFSSNIPGARIMAFDEGAFTSSLRFLNKVPGAPGNALAESMRITPTGDVGIGTTAIGAQLEVSQVDATGAVINATNNNAGNVGNTISAINNNATSVAANSTVGGGAAVFARKGAGLPYFLNGPIGVYATSSQAGGIGVAASTGPGGFAVWGAANSAGATGILGQTYMAGTIGVYAIGSAGSTALLTQGAVQMTGIGEAAGYILTSDGAGNATWQENTSLSVGISSHYLTVNLNIPSGVFVPVIQWNNLIEDGGANYNPLTGEYTITKTGVYQVNMSMLWDPFTANAPFVVGALFVNGFTADTHQAITANVASGQYAQTTMAVSRRFNAGDVLQANLLQQSGVNQTINANYYANSFSIQFVHK